LQPLLRALRSDECTVGTAQEPGMRQVRVGSAWVLVARLAGGEVVAFSTTCPHQATPLDDATVWDGYLRCPRHQYLYDLATGENVLPTRDHEPGSLWKLKPGYLPVHRVEERDGWIFVAERPEPPPPAYDPALEQPPARDRAAPGAVPAPALPAASGPVEHPVRTVDARLGEEVELTLPTSFSPGHMWTVDVDGGTMKVRGQRFQPGDQPVQLVRLWAGAPGPVTVRCSYATPWGGTPKEVRTFVVHVRPAAG
jgi:nitrite reductase/ring-hydroxylating ferredoxin subunit